MAKRTVLNRAAKFFINSSSDNDLLLGAVNDTTADEYDNSEPRDVTPNFDDLIDSKPKEDKKHVADADQDEPREPEQAERSEHQPVTDKEVANLFQGQANK
jgi:recombination protein RecT